MGNKLDKSTPYFITKNSICKAVDIVDKPPSMSLGCDSKDCYRNKPNRYICMSIKDGHAVITKSANVEFLTIVSRNDLMKTSSKKKLMYEILSELDAASINSTQNAASINSTQNATSINSTQNTKLYSWPIQFYSPNKPR